MCFRFLQRLSLSRLFSPCNDIFHARQFLPLVISLFAIFQIAGCSSIDSSVVYTVVEGGPPPPYGSSSLLGESGHTLPEVEAITPISLADAQECLADGKKVYALALQNANVRMDTNVDSCRMGRIPKGSLVHITEALTVSAVISASMIASSPPNAPVPEGNGPAPAVAYSEDIQPILMRTCNSCHSDIVKNKGLQVTNYEALMTGSFSGTVVIPGDSLSSVLWQVLESNKMPMIGALTPDEKLLIKEWIDSGAVKDRPAPAQPPAPTPATRQSASSSTSQDRRWFVVEAGDVGPVSDICPTPVEDPLRVVSADLLLPIACGEAPQTAAVNALRVSLALPTSGVAAIAPRPSSGRVASPASAPAASASDAPAAGAAPAAVVSAAQPGFNAANAAQAGIQARAFGLPAPGNGDGWLTPQGGFCIEQRLRKNERGITAIAFAPDGRIFLALDSSLAGEVDPLILYDAHHPSRSVVVYDGVSDSTVTEILSESPRITGMDWENGALYISRAGEVGRIPDGGAFERLAAGFAVNSQLFHANNGLVISNGWLYVSAGGVIDGYSDGPLVGIGEAGAQQIVSGGNPYAARIVRAPLDALVSQRSINTFSTAARGVRNPYGITVDPSGRIWFTDNGATNVPEDVSAGDEVNALNPGVIGGGEESAPYYGFPLALTPPAPEWYTKPVLALPNTAAPTGIAWAFGSIFFGVYGKDPGLYRLGADSSGKVVAERIMLAWPVLAVSTAPDGALWMGTGSGGLYRITPGCSN